MISTSSSAARRAATGLCLTAIALALSACGGSNYVAPPAPIPSPPAPAPLANQLYTQTNETVNTVVHLIRNTDGSISIKNKSATNGVGLNGIKPGAAAAAPDSLVSQHAITVSDDNTLLFAVNGGDSSVSVFSIDQTTGDLTLKKSTKLHGSTPSSLAFHNGFLYVVFQTGSDQLGAYAIGADGSLSQLGLYALPVAAGATPTQVVISPDGNFAVVSAGTGSNTVLSYPMNKDGTLATPVPNSTGVNTPFAGAFASATVYLSTDIGNKGLAAFTFNNAGALTLINAAVSGEAAPCWLSITPNGKFAYVGNGAGSISSYSVAANGSVTILNAKAASEAGVLTGVNSVAADSWISADGKFLYVTYMGDDKVVSYSIGADGALTKLNEQTIGTATHVSLHGATGI